MSHTWKVIPFPAIVGQEQMRLALVLGVVNPRIGGVLLRGPKGTGKSNAVRALARCLPEIEVVEGCVYSCNPRDPGGMCPQCRLAARQGRIVVRTRAMALVELPVGATEEMVAGGLEFTRALATGRREFMVGVLGRANRGLVYVDEVNLLPEHIVELVLGAAANGVNVVEREGLSIVHPARFVLIGSMNPEEGELAPQLLDRFGLCVETSPETELNRRVEIMKLAAWAERDPEGLAERFRPMEQELARRLGLARQRLPSVRLGPGAREFIAELCRSHHAQGHRAELVMEHAARALAAWEGRTSPTRRDIMKVAPMVLAHRSHNPLPPPPPPPRKDHPPPRGSQPLELPLSPPPAPAEAPQTHSAPPQGSREQVFEPGEPYKVRQWAPPATRTQPRSGSGRRTRVPSHNRRGRYVRAGMRGVDNDIALDATLRAAAPWQLARGRASGQPLVIARDDLRYKRRQRKVGEVIIFAVDASGSMGAMARMVATKAAVLSLLMDAYQKRDKVGLVVFRGQGAKVVVEPTSSVEVAARAMRELAVGGRTPLAAGLVMAYRQALVQLRREPAARPLVVVVSDGRANVGLDGMAMAPHLQAVEVARRMARDERVRFVVVDSEGPGVVRLGLARALAKALGAEYFELEELRAEQLIAIARG